MTRRLVCIFAALVAGCHEGAPSNPQFVAGGDPVRGEKLIVRYGCGSCHVVPGVAGARGLVGPSLAGFAERSFVAGRVRNEPLALVRWIQSPQSIDSLTAMPTLGVTEPHARDIAAYLYTLHGGGLGPPRLFPAGTIPAH